MNEKTIKNAFCMLVKFGSKDNLIKLQQGELYMKNLQYYVDLEKNADDEDVGDMYDGQMLWEDAKVTLFDYDTKEIFTEGTASKLSLNLGYLKYPVFCMFTFDYRNHTDEELKGDNLSVRYDFTDEQKNKLHKFGTHALIIKNGDEFVERVKKGLLHNDIGYSRDFVKYYAFNNIKHLREVKEDSMKIAFWKRQKYAYQQEYRFLAHTEVDDHLCVNIGDISGITQLVETNKLLNTYLQADFGVKNKS